MLFINFDEYLLVDWWTNKFYNCFQAHKNIREQIDCQNRVSGDIIDSTLRRLRTADVVEEEDGGILLDSIDVMESNSLSWDALCIFSHSLTSTSQPILWEVYLACLVKFPRDLKRQTLCVDVVNDHLFPLLEDVPQSSVSWRMLNDMSSIHVKVDTRSSWKALHTLLKLLSPLLPVDSECIDALIRDVDNHKETFYRHPEFWECTIYGPQRFQWLLQSLSLFSQPELNCAFSSVMQTTTWRDIGSLHVSQIEKLPFQELGSAADTLPRICIKVTSEHIAGILGAITKDIFSFPVGAWKCLRVLLKHTSDDYINQIRGEVHADNHRTLIGELEVVCYRACHACQVVPQPVPLAFVDLLYGYETAVTLLYILGQYTSDSRLYFDARMKKFISEYSRRKYIPISRIRNDHCYAYEGNYLTVFSSFTVLIV